MNKEELIEALRKTIQAHKVSSQWIESFRGKGYSEKQDSWINVYYIEEWLSFANDEMKK